jgi:hypothetical protein
MAAYFFLGLVIGAVGGFVVGALVYRNNVKRFQKNEADLRKLLQEKGIPWPF